MDNEIFPQIVVASIENSGKAKYEEKCLFHERILYRYLTRKIEKWSVVDFLRTEKIEKYALYAVTDFTDLFIADLRENNGLFPVVISDKKANRISYEILGYVISPPEEMINLYKDGKIQKVIVMSILHENEIISELLKKGILQQDLISIVSVLYS